MAVENGNPQEERARAEAAPPQDADGAGRQRRRMAFILLWALLMGLAFVASTRQQASLPRWAPDPGWFGWQRWLAPVEVNRWLRPASSADLRSTLHAVAVSGNGKTMLAVGERGTLLRSADGGKAWTAVYSLPGITLRAVALTDDGMVALAVGDAGKILRSGDGGQTWPDVIDVAPSRLNSVSFAANANVALASGNEGTLLRSDDLGKSWRKSGDTPPNATFHAAAVAPDGRIALAAGAGRLLLRSEDAGANWSAVTGAFPSWLQSVAIARDGQHALVAGPSGFLRRSADAGKTWQSVVSGRSASALFSVALSTNGRIALAAGTQGTLLRSDDGGESWSDVLTPSRPTLRSVAISADGLVALAAGDNARLLRSDDYGRTWAAAAEYQRWPAPWFWLLLLVTVAAAVPFCLSLLPEAATRFIHHLLQAGVSDRPVMHPDEDRLAFSAMVEGLGRFLRHSGTRPPLALAINARWGMGKSSLMNLLSFKMASQGVRPVWFNVWHHQHEAVLLAPMLQAIADQAIPGLGHWRGWVFRARLIRARLRRPGWAVMIAAVAPLSLVFYLAGLLSRSTADDRGLWGLPDVLVRDLYRLFELLTGGEWIAAAKGGGFGEIMVAALMALRTEPANAWWVAAAVLELVAWVMFWRYLMRPFPAPPATLLAAFNGRFNLAQAEAQADFRLRFRQHFKEVTAALQPRTLTVFIDDLDRCEPKKAAELLEAVNYLCDSGECFVILGMARELVEAQVAQAHHDMAMEQAALARERRASDETASPSGAGQGVRDRLDYARQYLRKLVQLDVHLPTLDGEAAAALLLGRAGGGADIKPEAASSIRKTSQAVARRLLLALQWLLPFALLGGLGWQVTQTVDKVRQERTLAAEELRADVQTLRSRLEDARAYEHWIRGMGKACEQSESAEAAARVLAACTYLARADAAKPLVAALDASLPVLASTAETGRHPIYQRLVEDKAALPLRTLQAYMNEPLVSGTRWPGTAAVSAMGASPSGLALDAAVSSGANPAGNAEAAQAPASQSTASTDSEPSAIAWWPLAAALAPAIGLAVLVWRRRDTFTIRPTKIYELAVRHWQEWMLRHDLTASPRELKRFMNVSRYVVARLMPAEAGSLNVPEDRIVEYTARWLVARDQGLDTGTIRTLLLEPELHASKTINTLQSPLPRLPERAREVSAFLQIVGELRDAEGDA